MELWSHQKFRCTLKVAFNIETFVYDDEGTYFLLTLKNYADRSSSVIITDVTLLFFFPINKVCKFSYASFDFLGNDSDVAFSVSASISAEIF
jgi:hypothetical protein